MQLLHGHLSVYKAVILIAFLVKKRCITSDDDNNRSLNKFLVYNNEYGLCVIY